MRALRGGSDQGIRADRVMTDNGGAYRFRCFGKALRFPAIRQIFTRSDSPKTNGKAERFIRKQTREGPCRSNRWWIGRDQRRATARKR